VVSGIVCVIHNGLQWKDAPKAYGPHKTLYNRCLRWSGLGFFDRIFLSHASEGPRPERIMIDSIHLKAHRTAASMLKEGFSTPHRAHPRRLELQAPRRHRPGRQAHRHASLRRPDERPHWREAPLSGAARGRDALKAKGIEPCIPPKSNRRTDIPYDTVLSKTRSKIEIMFGRLKHWRRIATRYGRCAHTFFSAICIRCFSRLLALINGSWA
jgi:transposase